MSIQITAIRLSAGTSHEHIVRLWWTDPATGDSKDNSRAEIVSWMETKDGKAFVEDENGYRVNVGVITPSHGEKYLRTYADRVWTDNLLALPRR
jgi:hypothetical protein